MNDLKLNPYDKLKSILTDGDLTDKGEKNLNEILGIEEKKKKSILLIVKNFFLKIDSLIFRKNNKMYNNIYHKRRKI